jgi:phosphoglycerate dehydrogenase-like enzyme
MSVNAGPVCVPGAIVTPVLRSHGGVRHLSRAVLAETGLVRLSGTERRFMGRRVVFVGDADPRRTQRAKDLLPPGLDVGFLDRRAGEAERREALKDCVVLINPGTKLNPSAVKPMVKLKMVQLMSAGFDGVDVSGLREMGIEVCNNSPAIANSVAEHTIALMLMVYRRLSQSVTGARAGTWQEPAKSGPHGRLFELSNRTVGIIGLGHIGSLVARHLRGFDTTTLYHDIKPAPRDRERELNVTRATMDELLERSDIVTVHVPLYSGTRGLMGRGQFRKMRPHAVFINTCRGPVHDEAALIQALQEGWIAGAGLDVTETEPTPLDNPLLKMDNAVVTPHIAGSSEERIERAIVFSYENAQRVLRGEKPHCAVEVLA